MITEERATKFKQTIANRQFDLAVILENVHDPHNIGAVLRTCESVGVTDVFIVPPEKFQNLNSYLQESSTSKGAIKWVNIHFIKDIKECMLAVKNNGYKIYGTHLTSEKTSVYELDLTKKVALLFGNEHAGISQQALDFVDRNFVIPQFGLVKSLNISVACAVTLYEACRQRQIKGRYHNAFDKNNTDHIKLYDRYISVHRGINLNDK